MNKFQKVFSIFLLATFILTSSTSVLAADNTKIVIDEFGDFATETRIDISDTSIDSNYNFHANQCTKQVDMLRSSGPTNPESYSITNVKKTQYNLFNVLTGYSLNNFQQCEAQYPTISWEKGESTSVSASASVTAGFEKLVKAEVCSSLGVGKSYTANTTFTYPIPYGYKGRIIFRYSQDSYTFKCVTTYKDGSFSSKNGSGTSSPYNTCYALQTVKIF